MEFSRKGTLSIFYLLFSIFYLTGRGLFCGLCNLFSNRKYKTGNMKPSFPFAGTTAFYFALFVNWCVKGGAKKLN